MQTISRLFNIIKNNYKGSILFLLILTFIGTAFEIVGLGILVPLFSILFNNQHKEFDYLFSWLNMEYRVQIILIFVIVFYVLKSLFLIYTSFLQSKFVSELSKNIANNLFRGYLFSSYTFHIQVNSSVIIRNLNQEIGYFTSVIQAYIGIIIEFSVLIGFVFVLVAAEPLGALIVVLIFGFVVFLFQKATKSTLSRLGDERQSYSADLNKQISHSLGGIKEILLLRRQLFFLRRFEYVNESSSKIMVKVNTLLQLPRIFLEIIALTALSTLIFVMLYQQKSMSNILTILGLFAAASFRMLPSVNRIMAFMQQIRFANSSIKLIFNEFVDFTKLKIDNKTNEQLIFETFEADKITFSYPKTSETTLKSVNLNFSTGEIIGIIGKSGSGKSTFIDLLLGLYEPLNGTFKVNDKPILIDEWQNIIGYVPQNIFLTDDSIRNNIAFGIPSELINEKRVNEVLEISQLSDFINDLPNGLETIVGERGISISGGQRQRIGIARALYNDPQILVFDEATSSLDSDTEKAFMDSLKLLFGRKTIIMVAHRLTTLVDCHKIYRFSNGTCSLFNQNV